MYSYIATSALCLQFIMATHTTEQLLTSVVSYVVNMISLFIII